MSKKDIYAKYGIEYKSGKILAPEFGWISPLLIDGNAKLGKGVWTFSTLAGRVVYHLTINGKEYEIAGTCLCTCDGCYAMTGFYQFTSTKIALAIRTYLAKNFPDFVKRAIIAQIIADGIRIIRIHASGEFFSDAYIEMWREIALANPNVVMWSYTKNAKAENAFDDVDNVNIVKSIVKGYGFNFGKCAYIIKLYNALKACGEKVYICRCGIDKNQHCTTCRGCVNNTHVLFIEHSTAYKAENDPLFAEVKSIIEAQAHA